MKRQRCKLPKVTHIRPNPSSSVGLKSQPFRRRTILGPDGKRRARFPLPLRHGRTRAAPCVHRPENRARIGEVRLSNRIRLVKVAWTSDIVRSRPARWCVARLSNRIPLVKGDLRKRHRPAVSRQVVCHSGVAKPLANALTHSAVVSERRSGRSSMFFGMGRASASLFFKAVRCREQGCLRGQHKVAA
jgi:hypothetical protein